MYAHLMPVDENVFRLKQVDFASHGVPPTAKILATNTTSSGGMIAVQRAPQTNILGSAIPPTMLLSPWALPDSNVESFEADVWVLWGPDSFVAPSFVHVVDALIHYTHNGL